MSRNSTCRPAPRPVRRLGHRTRPWLVWLVVAALLGLPPMPAGGGFAAGDAFEGDGPAGFCLADTGGRPPPGPSPHHGKACPFCLAHAGGFTPAAAAGAVVPPVGAGIPVAGVFPAGFIPAHYFLTGRLSRAPPPSTV